VPYQSEMTNGVATDIIKTGSCGLPTFKESYRLHIPFIRAVTTHIEKSTGRKLEKCPIT